MSPDARDQPPDGLSPFAVAMQWVSRIISICVEMVLPGLAGAWLDRRLGTRVVFTLVGMALGMAMAVWHLVAIARGNTQRR